MSPAILIHRNNEQTGPFPEAQVRQMLADGKLAAGDLAWRQGMAEWKPLSELLAAPAAVPLAPAIAAGGSGLKWGLAAGAGALVLALGGVGAWQYSQQQKIAAEQQRLVLEQQRLAEELARAEERRLQEEKKRAEEEMQRLAEEKRLAEEEKKQAEEKTKELEQRLAEERRAAERERRRERQYETRQRQVSDNEFVSRNSMNSPYATNPPPSICRECGVVQSIRPITREGQGSGMGAVAGSVVGGVLGNQVGRGRGRDAATVVGAIGGAVAGHQIEKSQRTTTTYEITVRFDDGSMRVFNQEQQPYWRQGDRVRVYNGALSGY